MLNDMDVAKVGDLKSLTTKAYVKSVTLTRVNEDSEDRWMRSPFSQQLQRGSALIFITNIIDEEQISDLKDDSTEDAATAGELTICFSTLGFVIVKSSHIGRY